MIPGLASIVGLRYAPLGMMGYFMHKARFPTKNTPKRRARRKRKLKLQERRRRQRAVVLANRLGIAAKDVVCLRGANGHSWPWSLSVYVLERPNDMVFVIVTFGAAPNDGDVARWKADRAAKEARAASHATGYAAAEKRILANAGAWAQMVGRTQREGQVSEIVRLGTAVHAQLEEHYRSDVIIADETHHIKKE